MRAIQYERFGEPAEVLHPVDLPLPKPGPGQVRVRMRVRPINPADLSAIRGTYGRLPELPAVPGNEGAGVVELAGEGVTDLEVGQQVVPLGGRTWQEHLVVDASSVIALPPGLSDVQAAMLLVNPTTAWLMLEDELRPSSGDWILQNAGNSAVGHYVVQIAKLRGYRTISVVRRRDVIAELKAAGADEVICDADEDVEARVEEITGGKRPRFGLESVGGESGARILRSLAPGGTMIVFGSITREPIPVEGGRLLFRGNTVRGWWLSQWFRTAPAERRAKLFADIIPLIASGKLDTPIGGEYDLGDVIEAVRAAESGTKTGKILLVG